MQQQSLISLDKSIIPSCDVRNLTELSKLVEATHDVEGIGAYKIGFELTLKFGIPSVVETIHKISDLPIIYDHQKACTDIPEMGGKFAEAVKGVDAVILFPMAGPVSETAWIDSCKKANFVVIVGGEMTHKGYLQSDNGFLLDKAPQRMYELAAENGIIDFVVPGNKPTKIKEYRDLLEQKGISPTFYSPGLVAQGGNIFESATAAGKRWHAIIGRALYAAKDPHTKAKELVKTLQQPF